MNMTDEEIKQLGERINRTFENIQALKKACNTLGIDDAQIEKYLHNRCRGVGLIKRSGGNNDK